MTCLAAALVDEPALLAHRGPEHLFDHQSGHSEARQPGNSGTDQSPYRTVARRNFLARVAAGQEEWFRCFFGPCGR